MPATHRRTPPRPPITSTGRRRHVVSDYVEPLNVEPLNVEPLNKEDHMHAIGVAASVVVGLVVVAGILVGVRSLPDLNRYRRMRQM